jgi:glutamate synthase domain-containing protein 2/glutamate synthase domain-containing protein 1/glutamate synthase domain-containing protein 3
MTGIPTTRRPDHQGLYRPAFEHDACGVGMICDINNRKSHALIEDALQILVNLTHRGACGCDETTGDGAGILMQKPHDFLQRVAREALIRLPAEAEYAAGLVFLPPDRNRRRAVETIVSAAAEEKGLAFLGWRPVPVNPEAAGDLARQAMPVIRMAFVGNGAAGDGPAFERRLYLMRKAAERHVRAMNDPGTGRFHIASLSARTLVYKGMLLADQMSDFFADLCDPAMASALALVHQRYSTNTVPSWDLAQPFRYLCHNGEINTVRGNINWMRAREPLFRSDAFGDEMADLFPVSTPGGSDSATLDNALELLLHTGRPLAQCMMMMVPEAWQHHDTMSRAKKDFYAYHACLMEPWDGPAAIPFTDGVSVGAVLDRNGLRPSRYTVTRDGQVIMASEAGVLPVDPANVAVKGRLEPGRMFLVDLEQGRIVHDDEIKETMAARKPYGRWLQENLLHLEDLPRSAPAPEPAGEALRIEQRRFGYTAEDIKLILGPMAEKGVEPTGSMGDDIPLAILSRRPRLLYDYFRQLFAQVTNPPLDAIRERLVTALSTTIGREHNLFAETPLHCRQLAMTHPVLSPPDLEAIRASTHDGLTSADLSICWPMADGGPGLTQALEALCRHAVRQVEAGARLLILSDRDIPAGHAPLPALMATAAVHHGLIAAGIRSGCGLIVDTGEAREIHHICCLLGYGAGAVVPWLALATVDALADEDRLGGTDRQTARAHYVGAVKKGILKVMSKMGISTLQSYRGAQIFECVGLDASVTRRWFTGTVSRIGGADMATIAREIETRCAGAWRQAPADTLLPAGGRYKWRRDGEAHQYSPVTIPMLQQAVRRDDQTAWRSYREAVHRLNREEGLIRGRFDFRPAVTPVPLEDVEPWTGIVRRFKTGAMSYGSISREAHETQAIAMNRIGGKSNSGEGGEDADRFHPDPNGDWRNSAIKQIASGRFGVTIDYLSSAVELQIKMAQGAKPGEGGQLPGEKVYPWIARTRNSTPYVGLISPPPHHDIYSIEDLAQLIYDLKCANPRARINVKLVSEVGVGTVAAGVAKAGADVILISGETGGTGVAPLTSIRYGGLPWELGLSETQQTLIQNGLRDRVVLECDGQLKTAHDVAVACLLGAQEFGFGTISLVALGCVMMRVCHLNTCPVGIATQDPELRKRFAGKPEHLIRLMRFIAEDLRSIMARLGFRTIDDMAGRVDRLNVASAVDHWKTRGLDLSPILHRPETPAHVHRLCVPKGLMKDDDEPPDADLIRQALPALDNGRPVTIELALTNVRRTLGTRLSHEIARRCGEKGLPEDTIVIDAAGSAGQSFFAFGARGITVRVKGEANDYFGKGLSGAVLAIRPPDTAAFAAEDNIIIGNVALYGATAGRAYVRGRAGERFCVRNSGASAVVEGVGDHGCEYMTGGRVVVLGPTGRNFAAGMSGGVAYVMDDEHGSFRRFGCNGASVDLEPVAGDDEAELIGLIEAHVKATGSEVAERLLKRPETIKNRFVKVMPVEYKQALARLAEKEE